MNDARFPRVASLKTAQAFRTHLETAGISLEFDDRLLPPESSPLAQPLTVGLWGTPIASRPSTVSAGVARPT